MNKTDLPCCCVVFFVVRSLPASRAGLKLNRALIFRILFTNELKRPSCLLQCFTKLEQPIYIDFPSKYFQFDEIGFSTAMQKSRVGAGSPCFPAIRDVIRQLQKNPGEPL